MKTQFYPDRHVELVERCKLGERKAQYELYKSYSKAMFNICMRILNHLGEAEDALQEAFVDAFTNLHQFRQQSTFGAWLKQIVVNKAINHMRSRKVKWVEIEEWQETMEDSDRNDNYFGMDEHETNLEVERVRNTVQKLPDGYRVVLSLYLFEGYDHEEIGEVLGISETTSRTQYMRAKRKLTEMLSK
ncbi:MULTISPECIES: RNA polymerase sigma factor [Dyadobacter]|uniref:Sigma-70 family RNA polymerase sigma factor n=2 Tax=Dyadobacter TaxID=120831 RepID=A0A9X1PBY9_9BACT|nr:MULTISPECIES: sigma-70 family RNA polymerase sigma factor [Dyadobacter]MCF0042399.1 sigma-70 family RNA polymerase sigma factor [Dyadobacter fanqingshengii]MCF2506589.1 sigma-70 family RNA polymerase sigma factor [Dyadobacter fanqingshengii]USJ35075.1 sigma-70 family RNA polymerase sigma factor [Dyadobacter fanqingshengii]SKC10690.1 RNA polymerase sigma-70 factor, ECF subfamily [Dyadobacter psychrophilus]